MATVGHDVGNARVTVSPEFQKELEAYKAYEPTAPRLSIPEELRTLVANQRFGTLCTVSSTAPTEGYAAGATAAYAVDSKGRIIVCLSNMSSHKRCARARSLFSTDFRDLQNDGRCSMVIANEGFSHMAEPRCVLTGDFKLVSAEDKAECRAAYLEKHPDSFWADFGDFDYFRMETVVWGSFIGGFARAGKVSGEEYMAAQPDPIAVFSRGICEHMNDDHADASADIIKHYAGMTVEFSKLLTVDRLGMTYRVVPKHAKDRQMNVRIAYSTPAESRMQVRVRAVELTKVARAALGKGDAAENAKSE